MTVMHRGSYIQPRRQPLSDSVNVIVLRAVNHPESALLSVPGKSANYATTLISIVLNESTLVAR